MKFKTLFSFALAGFFTFILTNSTSAQIGGSGGDRIPQINQQVATTSTYSAPAALLAVVKSTSDQKVTTKRGKIKSRRNKAKVIARK